MEQAAATREEIAQQAREHYERLSREACDWHSVIPEAITAWEREPDLSARNKALEKTLFDYAVNWHRLEHSWSVAFGDCTHQRCAETRALLSQDQNPTIPPPTPRSTKEEKPCGHSSGQPQP